jgi:hypothetical protein
MFWGWFTLQGLQTGSKLGFSKTNLIDTLQNCPLCIAASASRRTSQALAR